MNATASPVSTITPPPMQPARKAPRPVRWTVEQFHRAVENKVWPEGSRVILIRGEVLELGFMNPLHATGIRIVNAILPKIFPTGYVIQVQLPLMLGQETDPQPDFAVVAGEVRDFLNTHPTTAKLVIEVADSSLDFDMTTKAELYATAGIPEYWVLDLDGRRLIVYRKPAVLPVGGTAYRSQQVLSPTESVAPLAMPDTAVRVSDLLP